MSYRPTHVMMRGQDLNPMPPNDHAVTAMYVELDVILPVQGTDLDASDKMRVRVPKKKGFLGSWWLGFDPDSFQGRQYGYAIDMSMPHLRED